MAVLGFGAGFRDVREWYTRIALLERQTCLIVRRDLGPVGTAFLVGPDILLTVAHLFGPGGSISVDDGIGAYARFGFALSPHTGTISEGERYGLAANDWLVGYSPVNEFDIALVRLETAAGKKTVENTEDLRGWVSLTEADPNPPEGAGLAILQHAEGGPLKVSLNTNSIMGLNPEGTRLMYRTDTLPGSSGAPCFDIDWRFVAMHQSRSVRHGNHNLGVPFVSIRDWLKKSNLWLQASQKPPRILKVGLGENRLPQETSFGLEPELKAVLLQHGESQRLELKARATEPDAKGKAKIAKRLLNSVAAFMNSRSGGTVLIGVDDDKKFVGIENEYASVDSQKRNWDGFQLWLRNTLSSNLDAPAAFDRLSIARYHEDGKDICAVYVEPAATPVFVDNDLYVRDGNQNVPQRRHDLLAYVSARWPGSGAQLELVNPQSLPGKART
jgi:hypothetical protein